MALLQEDLGLKDARMDRLPPHRRPFYMPRERMPILEMRAARGWSAHQTAGRFLLTPTTVAAWMAKSNEEGANALLQLQEPVNKFPDLVRYIVQRLKVTCPRLGKVKIAEMLCRAGLHLDPTAVGRMLREEPDGSEPIAVATVGPVVRADRPNHVWHVDLTAVPTRLGFYVPWLPGALPQEWPFCWWTVVVLDHFSRRVQSFAAFEKKPDARALCASSVVAGICRSSRCVARRSHGHVPSFGAASRCARSSKCGCSSTSKLNGSCGDQRVGRR